MGKEEQGGKGSKQPTDPNTDLERFRVANLRLRTKIDDIRGSATGMMYLYYFERFRVDGGEIHAQYHLFATIGFARVADAEAFYDLLHVNRQEWVLWGKDDYRRVVIIQEQSDDIPGTTLSLITGRDKDTTFPF
jgi:hypothetical protein